MKRQNKITILLSFLLMLLIGCKTIEKLEKIHFSQASKIILEKEGHQSFFYWEIDNDPKLWETELGNVRGIRSYRDSLKLVLGAKTLEQAIAKERTQSLDKKLIEGEENGDRINALLVHTGSVAKVREINFLEAQMLNDQISKFPLLSHPTEFHGFICVNEKEDKLRIYIGSSDEPWPPKPTVIIEEIEKNKEHGWRLKYHLHNHYCEKKDNYIGILAPSLADAQYYKMLSARFNIDKALITNGYHTVEIDSKYFEQFESH